MTATFQNSAMVLSIGAFFTIITLGLAATLPGHLYAGLTAQGVPAAAARRIADLPPIGTLFAAFLGYNPVQQLLGPTGVLGKLTPAHRAFLTGRSFFPRLISEPFAHGLHDAFDFALVCCVIAAVASWLRGQRYVHGELSPTVAAETVDGLSEPVEMAPARSS